MTTSSFNKVVLTKEQKSLLRRQIFDRIFIDSICDYAEFEEEGLSYNPTEVDYETATREENLRYTITEEFECMAVAVYSVVAGDYRAYAEEYEAECEDDDNSPDWTHFVYGEALHDAKRYVAEGGQYCELDAVDIDIAIDNCLSEAVDLGFEDPFTAVLEALINF